MIAAYPLLDRLLSKEDIQLILSKAFNIRLNQVAVVDDWIERADWTESFEANIRIMCSRTVRGGEFPIDLEIFFKD